MSQALLITRKDIVQFTVIGGNVDTDKFIQNIKYAQDAKLEPLIGKALLAKLEDDVITGTLAGDYLTLVNDYIKDYLTYAAASDYIKLANFSVSNGGVSSYEPDNGNSASFTAIDRLVNDTEKKADFYGQRLIQYLKDNRANFSEYEYPKTDSIFNGWQLQDNTYNGTDYKYKGWWY